MIPVQLCKLFFHLRLCSTYMMYEVLNRQYTALMWMAQSKSLKCFEIMCECCQIYPVLHLIDRFSFEPEFM